MPRSRSTTTLESLASFTHNYSSPPADYDDSAAGGGHTHFLKPLRFRRGAAEPARDASSSPSASANIAARRRGPQSSLSILTDIHYPSPYKKIADRHSLTSSGSPGPLLQRDDEDCATCVRHWIDSGSTAYETSEEELYDDDDGGDGSQSSTSWATRWREQNPRVHPVWSTLPLTPGPPSMSSLALADDSTDDETKDVFATREIRPGMLHLPGSYSENPVIDPAAAQRAASERWEQRMALKRRQREGGLGVRWGRVVATGIVLVGSLLVSLC